MNEELYNHFIAIEKQLGALNANVQMLITDRHQAAKTFGALEERVRILEGFRAKLIGAVVVSSAASGILGGVLSTLLAHLL